ncbi:MAG: DUF3089 domain-containing protein [Bacteroidales bacterium]|nr:DUF3089 domain-containing protein [Bacteroidales bacterium]
MKKKHSISTFLPLSLLCLAYVCSTLSCRNQPATSPLATIPTAPNYADNSQWYIVDRHASVDLFYITSTETGDYSLRGLSCHYADTYNDSTRQLLLGEMVGVDQLLSGGLNFFSPYYRQCTLQSFTSDTLMRSRLPLAMGDARKAFAHYLEHLNGGRPFILAGFSQGGTAVVEILKHLQPEVQKQLVAAYVIGWKVTEADLKAAPYLRPAQDSADLGVVVCYNSVRDNSCAIPMLSQGNRFAINPVNWRTDATPATIANPHPTGHEEPLTVVLDTNSLLLQVSGYTRNDYILPLFGREGNYHTLEISLYQQPLRHNLSLRAQQFCSMKSEIHLQ